MRVTSRKFLKYFYVWLIVLWLLISIHVIYVYIFDTSDQRPVKWWTLTQATFSQPVYLPYISNDWKDLFLQSIIFDWCLSPYVEWTEIKFEENLCTIQTDNYRDFTVSVKDDKFWSNWQRITNEDIYFTYKNIIKQNKREITHLDWFSNLTIQNSWDNIKVEFPNRSIDNNIFFSNYILPSDQLEWTNISEYTENFWMNPIWSSCWIIDRSQTDANNVMFDMSKCKDSYISYYQARKFEDFEQFKNYQKDVNLVDYYIWRESMSWFSKNKVILNNFTSLFFNIDSQNLTSSVRRSLSNTINENIYTWNYQDYFIKDRFLFDTDISWQDPQKVLSWHQAELTQPRVEEKQIADLPEEIKPENSTGDFYLESINDEFTLIFNLDDNYDSISVQANDWVEYELQWYDWWKSARYNLSNRFWNINEWQNNYKVRWYKDWEWYMIYDINVFFQERPTIEIQPSSSELRIRVIYYENEQNEYIAKRMKEIFGQEWIIDFFEFESFESSSEFQWQMLSKNYDITIRWINMWLKKDISNLFTTSNRQINPSWYVNNEIASNINQYFLTEWNTKQELLDSIHSTYSNEVPFIIFWKSYSNINIKNDLDLQIPKRLYDFWIKKKHLDEVQISFRPEINPEQIFDLNNFINFIQDSIQ